jgi:ketosteroid isomerase-like protein
MADASPHLDPVEVIRDVFAPANGEEHLDAFMAFIAPDAVWDLRAAGTDPSASGIFRGARAIAAVNLDWWSMWEDHHHYVEEIVDMGHGIVFAVLREDSRVRGSDTRVDRRNAWVTEWVGSLNVYTIVYPDIDEGRAAAERLAQERGVPNPQM